jgi:hypothetical protein
VGTIVLTILVRGLKKGGLIESTSRIIDGVVFDSSVGLMLPDDD